MSGGLSYGSSSNPHDCFWDIEISGQTISSLGTGKTTAYMQNLCTYTMTNWDFIDETDNGTDDYWGMNTLENNGYPFLAWQGYTHNATCCAWPSESATNTIVGTITTNSILLESYTAPISTADGYAIYINNTDDFEAPSMGENPIAETSWADAGQQCVYQGASITPNVNVENLDEETKYFFNVYAYNNCGITKTYEIAGGLKDSIYTASSTHTVEAPANGDGTEADPYQIATLENLAWLSQDSYRWDKYYIQTADIDASTTSTWNNGEGFSPIGNSTTQFTGQYDGQNYIIDNLFINRISEDYIGLFGYIFNSLVENINLTNVDITGSDNVGALAGLYTYNPYQTFINNCNISGEVNGEDNIGGLIGKSKSIDIKISSSSATVNGHYYVGGLIGYVDEGSMDSCYTTGNIIGVSSLGGFIGKGYFYNGSINISYCYTTGNVMFDIANSSGGNSIGGFIGYTTSSKTTMGISIEFCYATGNVLGNTSVGGFIGSLTKTSTSNCYATGDVDIISTGARNGGFVGYSSGGEMVNCYSVGHVTSGTSNNAGFVAENYSVVTNCFWDTETAGITTSAAGVGKTSAEMFDISTYTDSTSADLDSAWDFTGTENNDAGTNDYWKIAPCVNNNYPSLAWQNLEAPIPAGAGTSGDPYQIATLCDLNWVSTNSDSWDKHFIQTANIDASETSTWNSGEGFSPIGDLATQFTGIYDGQKYSIDGIFINRPDGANPQGLFGYPNGSSVEIKNISLTNVNVTGKLFTGALVGKMFYGVTVSNCYSTGSVTGISSYTGGLVGYNLESTIINSYNMASVTGTYYVGGISGRNKNNGNPSVVNNCYSTGTVTGTSNTGALIGANDGTVENCFFDENAGADNSIGTAQSTARMKDIATFTNTATTGLDVAWDFQGTENDDAGTDDIWNIDASTNDGYPYLEGTFCSGPSEQATALTFGTSGANSVIFTGLTAPTNGADGYAIYVNSVNTFIAPNNGVEPTADLSWNGSGQQCIYFGTSTNPNITITDLDCGETRYYFTVYAYTDCSGTEKYETTGANANKSTGADVTIPLITSTHNNINVDASAGCSTTLPDYTGDVVATDNCDNSLTITQSPSIGTTIGGTNTVTLKATDDAGNHTEVSFEITVVDNTNPVITSTHTGGDIDADANCSYTVPDYTADVVATDNCDNNLTITQSPTAGTIVQLGTTNVTLRATDDAGNYVEKTFDFDVVDNTNPVITSTHNNTEVNASANCNATLLDYTNNVIATDNCDNTLTITQTPAAGTTITGATNTVTLKATDDEGNYAEKTFNVAVIDNTYPVITSTHNNINVDASASCNAILADYTGTVTATDNCDNSLTITQTPSAGITIGGTNTVTLRATDDAGNYTEVSFEITVVDVTNPVITSTQANDVLEAVSNCEIPLPDYTTNVVATDNCDNSLTITQSPLAGTSVSGATNTVTLKATDDAGNYAEQTFNVSVEDNTAPVVTSSHGNQFVDGDINDEAILLDYTTSVVATDNCDANFTIVQSPVAGTTITNTTTVTITLTDNKNNITTIIFDVIVNSNETVITTEPVDLVEICPNYNAQFGIVAEYASTYKWQYRAHSNAAWNDFGNSYSFTGWDSDTLTAVIENLPLFENYLFRCIVSNSNSADTSNEVTVTFENELPVLTTNNYTAILDANGNITVNASDVVTSATDNCQLADTTLSISNFDCSNIGTPTVIDVSLTDISGNQVIETATVTVVDNSSPVLTVQNITVQLDEAGEATISKEDIVTSLTDNCSVSDTVVSQYNFDCSDIGTPVNVNVIGIDAQGNQDIEIATITVEDNITPMLSSQNATIYLDETGNATLSLSDVVLNATDNCEINDTTLNQTAFTCANIGTPTTVYVTLTDVHGNEDIDTVQITVVDNIDPVITSTHNDVNIDGNASCEATLPDFVALGVTATDNCSSTFTITQNPIAGTVISDQTLITITVTDESGNSTEVNFNALINDVIVPVITSTQANDVLEAVSNCEVSLPDYTTNVVATDNCDNSLTITQSPLAGTSVSGATNTITLKATDDAGNYAEQTFNVSVEDNTAPVVTSVHNTQYVAGDVNDEATLLDYTTTVVATDNCDANFTIVQSPAAGTTITGTTAITITLTDDNNNVSEINFDVIVNSNEPIINSDPVSLTDVCPINNITFGIAGEYISTYQWQYNAGTSWENISNTSDFANFATDTLDVLNPENYNGFDFRCIASNLNGADTSAIVSLTLEGVNPVLTTNNFTAYIDASGNVTVNASDVVTSATDNCQLADTTLNISNFDCSDIGTSTVIDVTLNDLSGNNITEPATITVVDTLAPVLTAQNITVQLDENGNASITTSDVVESATDNCTIADTTLNVSTFDCSNIGTPVNVDITLTDIYANETIETAIITVEDNITPMLSSQNATIYLDANGDAILYASNVVVSATDNCEINDTVLSRNDFDCSNIGTPADVYVTLSDISGNEVIDTVQITVIDTLAPTITSTHNNINVGGDTNCEATLLDYTASVTATDNCSSNLTITQSPISGTTFTGYQTVTITVEDENGNTSETTFDVIINDVIEPELTIASVLTVELDATGNANITAADVVTSATDNCAIMDTTLNITTFDCSNIGTPIEVIVTLSDAAGNTDIDTVTVTVEDNIAPTLSVQNLTVQLDENGTANISIIDVVTATNDNCSISDTIIAQTTFDCSNVGTPVNVDITLSDANGNQTVETAIITVADTIDPTIVCIENQERIVQVGENEYIIQGAEFNPTNTDDNCNYTIINDFNNSESLEGASLPIATTTIEWTITDDAGNITTCTFDVFVDIIEGIIENTKSSISIYPNPTADQLSIINYQLSIIETVEIIDITGKIYNSNIPVQENKLSVKHLTPGIYFLKITTTTSVELVKFIKE